MEFVEIPPRDIETGAVDATCMDAALRAFEEDGVVALPGIVDTDHIDALADKMLDDIRVYAKTNEIGNNYQGLRPPPFHPFLFADIVLNEIVIAISHRILGDGVRQVTYGANTAFVGSKPQRVHTDSTQLWPSLKRPTPCARLVVNIPLVDVTEANGATVHWPGTHHDPRFYGSDRFPTDDMIAERETVRPSERVLTRRGDVVLRDMRVWHGGMPNTSDTPRPMLAMVQQCGWLGSGGIEFEKGAEEFLDHPVLTTDAVFLDARIDYMHQGHSRPQRR
ncbi:hypothetical protein HN371_05950 [Candidatus Poribacteria bacterium]|jgi:hypothetical protein|nr:hypothetical protein [Candidatus Poribacteria bacterium]MBT5713655.1 hypothetical protein [Candidatus Poribacteria bacterium]MBT7098441.1 hypothetical protein [Candidatus Poribacteria bacterium]MBT7805424.1 hypothetical protein [Candidatus Poribacteria bacterium]